MPSPETWVRARDEPRGLDAVRILRRCDTVWWTCAVGTGVSESRHDLATRPKLRCGGEPASVLRAGSPASRLAKAMRDGASPPSVVVIEDQGVLAGALRTAIGAKTDMNVTGVAGTLEEGVALVRAHRPDVVVSDYRLPDGDLPTRLGDLHGVDPKPRVLVFTAWSDEGSLLRAMAAGVAGYVDKGASLEDFIDALQRVAGGEVVVSPRFLPLLTRRAVGSPTRTLTPRELEVLDLLAKGASTLEIAETVFVAPNTVRNYVTSILAKLGAGSRLEAVRLGVEGGLIRYDPPRRGD